MEATLRPLLHALSSDGFQVAVPKAEDLDNDVVMYMGNRARKVRNGDHVTYLHPDEPSQEIIGVEYIPEDPNRGPLGKRTAREEGDDDVSETGLSVASDDDLPALEPVKEGAWWKQVKAYPMMMYGDVQKEMDHTNIKSQYSRSNSARRCHRCSHRCCGRDT